MRYKYVYARALYGHLTVVIRSQYAGELKTRLMDPYNTIEGNVLHRVLYPQVHENGFQK
jgi:hypothetical protein